MSLTQFLDSNHLPGNILIIQVIRKLKPCVFIVGDSSGLALLDITENPHHEKELKVTSTVKLLKPVAKDKQTINTNKKFKPMQTKQDLNISPSEEDILKLNVTNEEIQPKSDSITFQTIMTNTSQTIISLIIVLITNVSKIIETKMGKYQIIGVMDKDSKKLSLNLYDANIGKLEFGNIYRITKVKKLMIKKEEGTELRLTTTKFTKISKEDNEADFENVRLAENLIKGTILGYSEINIYLSCQKHWNKLSDDGECPKCEGSPTKTKSDFNTDLYVQDEDTTDIKSFLIFKRQAFCLIDMKDNQVDEESIINKMNELEGKECTVEFDEPTDEENPIIPKRLKLSDSD